MQIKLLFLASSACLILGAMMQFPDQRGGSTSSGIESGQHLAAQAEAAHLAHNNPVELGSVHWLRDLDEGRALAKQSGKPLLVLFQEVPGCSNCTRYGNGPLRHPLLVESIETFFVPVCIYNNKGGKDGTALRLFDEPAWNNPVVRIVRPDNSDLIPRIANFSSPYQLVKGIGQALAANGQNSPVYLKLLETEWRARESGLETATFSMYCFWSGEGTFGAIPGVIETEPGFQDGHEVVKVQFDPSIVAKSTLEALTHPKGINSCARNEGFRSDRTPKYYLANTDYRFIPMTSLQACQINSLIGEGKNPDACLSPRQLSLLKKIRAQPDKKWKNQIGGKDLAGAWEGIHD